MFKKRLFLALALAGLTVGTAVSALNKTGVFTSATATAAFNCTGGGSESFNNIPASSSTYLTRTWTGDNGVAWSATDARTDQTLTGKAIALRTSTLKNTNPVPGGVGTITFKYKRVFTGNSTLKVFVNGIQYGSDITVSSETASTFSQVVNVSGNVSIEIRNSGNRTIVDDVAWTCYSAPVTGPEIQLANAGGTNVNCGELTLNYGSQSIDVFTDAVFSIKNSGSSVLNVSSLSLSNSVDFQIISPTGAFTVPASGSAIVVVRFDAATAGAKTSVLTVNSDDADESECTVNLSGTGLAVCVAPVVVDPTITVTNITPFTADVTVGNVTADNYLAVVTVNDTLTAEPVDGFTYSVGSNLGGGVVAYNGSAANFTINGLAGSTDYNVFVFAYNSVDCSEGPKYDTKVDITSGFTTPVAPCFGGAETFDNMPANSSTYTTRSWTGNNSIAWTATDARTDQTLNGRAIAIRTGSITNTTPTTGGIGTLSFSYKRVFTGDSTLKVFVNGVQVGGDITVTSDIATTFTQVLDIPGNVTVEIENSGNRTIIDDLTWDCYTAPNRPEIQLLDETLNRKACGDFVLDFGTVEVNTSKQATFVVRNEGLLDLEVTALTLSDASYTIVSPALPFTVAASGSQDVVVAFNSATTGSIPATLTVVSNDADEASCVIDLTAVALAKCAAPAVDTASADFTNITFNSADVEVTGVTASGYIAVVSTGAAITAPVNGTVYQVGDTLGGGTVAYVGTDSLFTISGLLAETTYTVFIYAFNNTDCLTGPAYSTELEGEIETAVAPCIGGSETFTNMPANASAYTVRNWTGDNSVNWTATDARTDQTLTGRAIAIRTGYVENTTSIAGGIGTLTFNYKRVFTGNSTLKVFVNGVQVGADVTVSSDTPTVFSQVVNVTGNVTIRIENSGNRTIIDDIAFDCYSGSSARPAAFVNEAELTNEAKLYPNPNNGQFQVELPAGHKEGSVEVYNMGGKLMVAKKVSANEMIDLGNAERGIYMVTVKAGGTTTSKKVVVK